MQIIPYLQVRTGSVCLYDQYEGMRMYAGGGRINGAYSGNMTDGGRKRVMKAIDIFLQRNPTRIIYNPVADVFHPFRIGFVTLTVSDRKNRTHREAYPLLKELIRTARRKHTITDYIWKAELQERGQIHYHLTVNEFWHFQEIRDRWNQLQRKAGFLSGYAREHGHYNPNSTDVHSVIDVENLGAYLAKYIAKEVKKTGKGRIDGKVWDCSEQLKAKRFATVLQGENDEKIRELLKTGKAEKIELEHCVIVKMEHPDEILTASQKKEYRAYLAT